jgi:hypothetical protein
VCNISRYQQEKILSEELIIGATGAALIGTVLGARTPRLEACAHHDVRRGRHGAGQHHRASVKLEVRIVVA